MNKFIGKILKEATGYDDSFFQPKDILKRDEEIKRMEDERRKKFSPKIKLGLQNIKIDYENKNWDSEQEKSFLKIFSKLRLNEKYDEYWSGYFLEDENNRNKGVFDLQYHKLWISYNGVWKIFEKRFHWNYGETERFMKNMLKKHFKLYEFTPAAPTRPMGKS